MLPKVIAVACFAVLAGVSIGFAQSDGPAELPSADYQGQSYVDSKGCIFLKAGYGGEAAWVPRVGQDRKPICGQTPTDAVAKVADAASGDVPSVRKTRVKKKRLQVAAPQAPVMIGCPVSVPVARRYGTTDGGSVVICTATNGSLTGARSPIYPVGSGVGAALSNQSFQGLSIPLPNVLAVSTQKQILAGETAAVSVATNPVPAHAGFYYVQVGAFGQPSNATAASERLAALGLPVSKANISKKGQALQLIYAGPFVSGAEARGALMAVQSHGFSDAYLR